MAFAQVPVAPVTFAYNGPPQNSGYTTGSNATLISISVSSLVTVTKVTATVNISYPAVGDLNLYLFSPDGTRTKLLERNCTGTPNATLVNITFDDAASTSYSSFCPAEAGRGPGTGNEPLTHFNNKLASGTWILAVQSNSAASNAGVVNGASLSIAGTLTSLPTISANAVNPLTVQPGPIAPGELIAISGSNIGPATAIAASAATLPTTVGGSQVMINDTVAAPIFFASSTLVGVVVPYSATVGGAVGGGAVKLSVIYSGIASNPITVSLAPVSPGLFPITLGDTGKTSVKAINPDGTLNSSTNPVTAGSTLLLYGAGLGLVTPAFTAGQSAPSSPLYTTVAQTFVSFAGQAGTVLFSGLALTTEGVCQVNVTIPKTVPTGTQPVLLWNSSGASKSGLQIYIK